MSTCSLSGAAQLHFGQLFLQVCGHHCVDSPEQVVSGFYRWGWQSVLGDFGTRSPMGSPLADSMVAPSVRLGFKAFASTSE